MSNWSELVINQVINEHKSDDNTIRGLHNNVELHLKLCMVAYEEGKSISELMASKGYEYIMYADDEELISKLKNWVTSGYVEAVRELADSLGVKPSIIYWELGGNVRYRENLLSEQSVIEWLMTDYAETKVTNVKTLPDTIQRHLQAMGYDTEMAQKNYLKNLGLLGEGCFEMSFTEVIDALITKYPNFVIYNFPETDPELYNVVQFYGRRANMTYHSLLTSWGFTLKELTYELSLVGVYRELAELFPSRSIAKLELIPRILMDYLMDYQANTGMPIREILKTASFKLEGEF